MQILGGNPLLSSYKMTPKEQLNGEKWDGELILLPGADAPNAYMHASMPYVASTVSAGTRTFLRRYGWQWEYETWEELAFKGLATAVIFNYIFSWFFYFGHDLSVAFLLLLLLVCWLILPKNYQSLWIKNRLGQHPKDCTFPCRLTFFSRTLQYVMKSSPLLRWKQSVTKMITIHRYFFHDMSAKLRTSVLSLTPKTLWWHQNEAWGKSA